MYMIKNYANYGTKLTALMFGFIIFIFGVIYSTFFLLSLIFFYSDQINILFWKITIISGIGGLGIVITVFSFLKEYKKIPIFAILPYAILYGVIIGYLFFPNSLQIKRTFSDPSPHLITDFSTINYIFDPTLRIIIAVLDILITAYILYVAIYIYFNARNKAVNRILLINACIFIFPILMYILYIFFQSNIFRGIHIFILFINFIGVCIILVKKPDLFLLLTNKVYDINIYHKSGVLLYAYKFSKLTKENDSAIWGNILIGINHILSEFIDKKDQIDVFQTKNTDIIVNYDNEYGFATLVLTNQKNKLLENLIGKFVIEFREKYKKELIEIEDLNKIINVSEFQDTKEIIEQNFSLYI